VKLFCKEEFQEICPLKAEIMLAAGASKRYLHAYGLEVSAYRTLVIMLSFSGEIVRTAVQMLFPFRKCPQVEV